jgi:hypothetical protein
LKFENNWPYHQREMKKMKYAHKNLKWKILKIFIFFEIWNIFFGNYHFWNLKWKFPFEIWKKIGHDTRGKWKKIEMKKSYITFMQTSTNTPIPPMYATLYRMCKL